MNQVIYQELRRILFDQNFKQQELRFSMINKKTNWMLTEKCAATMGFPNYPWVYDQLCR